MLSDTTATIGKLVPKIRPSPGYTINLIKTIARTILKNPKILILDDATSSVDVETEIEIRVALERLMENRTTFIIAHRIQSVINADQIVVLDKGQIVQLGSHEELLSSEGIYRRIYDIQTRIEKELELEIHSAINQY